MQEERQHFCIVCGALLLKAELYDPEGVLRLYGGEAVYEGKLLKGRYICINPACRAGQRNLNPVNSEE